MKNQFTVMVLAGLLALASALPGAHAVVIRRAAHAPFLSHPDEFLGHVLPFIGTKVAA